MELAALIRALAPSEVTPSQTTLGDETHAIEIVELAYDTRDVSRGTLFFCVKGGRADGHELAWEAIERGAVALVVERQLDVRVPQLIVPDTRAAMAVAADTFFGEPSKKLEVVGATGTNGKTTTAFLLRSILEAAGRQAGLIGTVEWVIGGTRRPAPFTTPEAIDIQRLFREMLAAGDRSVALEASSHGAALRRLDRVRFDALVFTNLSQDHLDLHGTMEEYFLAKKSLFSGAQPPPAAVNVDDEWGRRLAQSLADEHRAPLVTFGLGEQAEIRAVDIELTPSGSRFQAAGMSVETSLPGGFNVSNALGAVAAGVLLDLDEEAIRAGIAAVEAVPGRFERVDEGQPFTVLVDYAHTPDSLESALGAARDVAEGRVLVVFGAGGDRDRAKRPLMGKVAVTNADLVIVTSDNPRSEDPLGVIQDVLQGAGQGTGMRVEIDPDRRTAIERAIGLAEPGDVVVIAGKGHEQGQDIGGVVHPFDDRTVAREVLSRLRAAS